MRKPTEQDIAQLDGLGIRKWDRILADLPVVLEPGVDFDKEQTTRVALSDAARRGNYARKVTVRKFPNGDLYVAWKDES